MWSRWFFFFPSISSLKISIKKCTGPHNIISGRILFSYFFFSIFYHYVNGSYLVVVLVDFRVRSGTVLAHLEFATETHARIIAFFEAFQAHPTSAGPTRRLFGQLRFGSETKHRGFFMHFQRYRYIFLFWINTSRLVGRLFAFKGLMFSNQWKNKLIFNATTMRCVQYCLNRLITRKIMIFFFFFRESHRKRIAGITK